MEECLGPPGRRCLRNLVLGASVASLLGVGYALILAGRHTGPLQVLLIGIAVLTIVASWTVVNTVYALRYTERHWSREAGIGFGNSDGPEATSRTDGPGNVPRRPAGPEGSPVRLLPNSWKAAWSKAGRPPTALSAWPVPVVSTPGSEDASHHGHPAIQADVAGAQTRSICSPPPEERS